jgi:hypothetical protein
MAALSARWAEHARLGEEMDQAEGASGDLTSAELCVFSQNGEDGVLEEIFRRIGACGGGFVEFGIETGVEGNCVFLAEVLGWRGLFIEADPAKFELVARRYRDRASVAVTNALVTPLNIDQLISDAGLAGEIDVLSIDIDSHDYWVWEATTAVSPRVVVIEYNSHIAYPTSLVQPLHETDPWNGTDYFGASLAALELLGERKGYSLVHTDLAGVNAFFVRSDLAGTLPQKADVPRRSPNFFLSGSGHPTDLSGRLMEDPTGTTAPEPPL